MVIKNRKYQSGGATILYLVFMSSLFFVLIGIASLKMISVSKQAAQMNEAYNYLLVMEEIGQQIAKARTLGRLFDCQGMACPGGTAQVLSTLNAGAGIEVTTCGAGAADTTTYSLCVPNTDGDGIPEASDFCANVAGVNYCLSATGASPFQGLQRLDVFDQSGSPFDKPLAYSAIGGASTQRTIAGPAMRGTQEPWTPLSTTWATANEIFTTRCGTYPGDRAQYWLGCDYCADPNVDCWQMSICKPPMASPTALATNCAAGSLVHQGIMIYFENNK